MTTSDVTANIRDLIIHLHRGNQAQAEDLVGGVEQHLKEMMRSGEDPHAPAMQKARQTMFAMDEVRMLLSQRDFTGAVAAARDAAKEWK